MKRIVIVILLIYALSLSSFGQKQGLGQQDKYARQLSQFESDWLKASLNLESGWLERFMTGKLSVIISDNNVVENRARVIAGIADPTLKPVEIKFRITGNIHILTNSEQEGSGNRSYFFLDTFNKRGGKWQIIASHFSEVSELPKENVKEAIAHLEREFKAMIVKRDASGIAAIVAENFTGVEKSGRIVNKNQLLNAIQSENDNYLSHTIEGMEVRIYEGIAIAVGRLIIKKSSGESQILLFTDVWAKRNEGWRIVSSQDTPVRGTN